MGPVRLLAPEGAVLTSDTIIAAGTTVAKGTVLGQDASVSKPLLFAPDHFRQGSFANFGLTGNRGLTVASGTVIAPTYDILQLTGAVRDIATGASLLEAASSSGSGVTLTHSADLPEWQRQATDLVLGSTPDTFADAGGIERRSGWNRIIAGSVGRATVEAGAEKIGRAHVCTSVTNAPLVCRLLHVKKK